MSGLIRRLPLTISFTCAGRTNNSRASLFRLKRNGSSHSFNNISPGLEEPIGGLDAAGQPEFLRQTLLQGAEEALHAPAGLGRVRRNMLDAELLEGRHDADRALRRLQENVGIPNRPPRKRSFTLIHPSPLVHRPKRRRQPKFGKLMHRQRPGARGRERSECAGALVRQRLFEVVVDGAEEFAGVVEGGFRDLAGVLAPFADEE